MKKYRCTNCDYKWEAQDEPFECPKCHSANIESGNGGGSFGDALKKFWWVIVAAIAVAVVAVLLLIPKNSTSVHVDANLEDGVMTVKLAGKHAGEYIIRLNNGERSFATSPEATEAVFTDLIGDYVLDLVYVGTGEAPKIREYEKNYTFANRIAADQSLDNTEGITVDDIDSKMGRVTNKPEIKKVTPHPARINKGETYKITVQLGKHGCTEQEAEFSLDSIHWQKSNEFTNLQPGKYYIYARKTGDPTLCMKTQFLLKEPGISKCLSAADVNGYISRYADYESKAYDELLKYVSNNTPVNGVAGVKNVQQMMMDCSGAVKYQVVSVQCNGNKIESLTITAVK